MFETARAADTTPFKDPTPCRPIAVKPFVRKADGSPTVHVLVESKASDSMDDIDANEAR